MKKFALFAMLVCAGILTFGCAEKKATPPKTTDSTTAAEKTTDAGAETPAAEKPAP